MDEQNVRITKPGNPPTDSEIGEFLGEKAHQFWKRVIKLVEQLYPNVFSPEWLYGGKKHGWSLRYKKSKSFCTLIPEKKRFALLIVFGAGEREKVDEVKKSLSQQTRKAYDQATTYHDGKWLRLSINNDSVVEDIKILLAVKRKPKGRNGSE